MTAAPVSADQDWEITDPSHRRIYQKAEPFLQIRHNAVHTRISYHFALKLLEEEGGDPEVVIPAILLHDIGYSKISEDELRFAFGPKVEKPELRELHEVEGARLAGEILESLDYPEESIQEIRSIINGHDTRDSALNVNDAIVQDSDKLFRFTFEAWKLASKYLNADPWKRLRYLDKGAQTWFFTETAKRLAAVEAEKTRELLERTVIGKKIQTVDAT